MLPFTLVGIAVAQLGLFSTAQCRENGLDSDAVEWLLRGGHATSYRRSVLKAAGTPPLPEHPALAACLAGGNDTVATTWTAGALWGLPRCGLGTAPYVTSPRRLRLAGVRYVPPPAPELASTVRRNVPLTTAATTIALLDGTADADLIQQMVDHAIRWQLCTREELERTADDMERVLERPLRDLRTAVARAVPDLERTDNCMEAETLREIHDSGVILPVLQFQLAFPERLVILDAAWPAHRVGVEVKHSLLYRQAAKWANDDEKSNLYAKYGWTIFTRTEQTGPGVLADRLRAVLPLR